MAKDYAKRSSQRAKRQPESPGVYRARWFLLGLLTGIIPCLVLYTMPWQWWPQFSAELKQKNQPTKIAKKKPDQKPQFDFYSMLPQMDSNPPQKIIAQKPPQASESTTQEKSYLIQAASLTKASDAKRMKAELLLAGFDVDIQLFVKGDKTWYRVLIGPFKDITVARKQQQQLKTQKIDSLLITQNNDKKNNG